jgi:hypothetical protein
MKKFFGTYIIERILLVVCLALLTSTSFIIYKQSQKITELSQHPVVVKQVVVVTPTLAATPSAKLLPSKTLLKAVTPVVTKAVVK